jgi:hypothetical protein
MLRMDYEMELQATPKVIEFLGQNGETDDNGRKALPKYAWPGGYPVFYVTNTVEIVCAMHATETVYGEGFDGESIVAADINWESPDMYCTVGESHRIESAYGED